MAGEVVAGLADTYALLGELPPAAQHELADLLGRIGRDVLAAQRAAVPKATGTLAEGLSERLLTEELRVRVGLLGLAVRSKSALRRQRSTGVEGQNLGDLYYGRFVELGRREQTVVVERRRAGAPKLLRNRRKRVEDLIASYTLRVRPMAPREFIYLPETDTIATSRLADFWSRVFASAGAAA